MSATEALSLDHDTKIQFLQ